MNLDKHIEKLSNGNLLDEKELLQVINLSLDYYSYVSNIINISAPITVVGDIHGQFVIFHLTKVW
jgi:hypothetical protein